MTLEQALETRKILEQDISGTEREISSKTYTLQKRLEAEKEKLKSHNKLFEELAKDKNEHILDRFYIWLNYVDKSTDDWIIDQGPMREEVLYDEYRYSTIDLVDRLIDWVADFTYDLDGFDGKYFKIDTKSEENLELFNRLDKEDQERLTRVLEDAIEQNVEEFTYDW